MTPYRVVIPRAVTKSIAALEAADARRIRAAIDLLATNPRPPACLALSGETGVYRVRVGNYRILYEVNDGELVVIVVRIGHRREIYRR